MLNKEKIKKFILENKWIMLASIFFIVWKFFLIGVMWHDRLSPPEPDDSYVYTGYINSVKECPNFLCNYPNMTFQNYSGFTYLSYRLFFGSISKFFNIDPVELFHSSFYLGILLLIPILVYFLSHFTKNKKLIAFSLFFFALYNGNGSYHGFFWIVPSFFAVALFFLIFSILLSKNKHWIPFLTFLVPVFIFMHDISTYTLSVLLFYSIASFLIKKKIDTLIVKKIIFIFILASASYLFMKIELSHFNNLNPRSVQETFSEAGKNISIAYSNNKTDRISNFKNIFPAFREFNNAYILWLFPNFIGVMFFGIILFFLIKYKRYEIISLYFSALIFSFASLSNTYGFRSLIILWPITFLFYAHGSWYGLRFVFEKKLVFPRIIKFLTIFCLFFFIILNLFYSYAFADNINKKDNTKIDTDFVNYLVEKTPEKNTLHYDSKIIKSYVLNTPLINNPMGSIKNSDYIVSYQESSKQTSRAILDTFFDTVSNILEKPRNKTKNAKVTDNNYSDFNLEKEFGEIKIYKKK